MSRRQGNTMPAGGDPEYTRYPEHPLYGVPHAVLAAARSAMAEAVYTGDVEADQAEAIADAVVCAVLPSMRAWLLGVHATGPARPPGRP